MALKSSPFSDSLCKQSPTTLDKLRARIVGFIHMEEMTKFKEKVHGESSRKPTKREAKTKSSHNKGKSRVDRPPQSKFSQGFFSKNNKMRRTKACQTQGPPLVSLDKTQVEHSLV
ncbi:hypothetical protein JHK82_052689 [Glycine max]|nr:hypothetical protein JHK85_053382 [Glycine max]KAG5082536.1 hypothetical protein JHK84_052574 [Glycine max]KAG5085292.1 hypothetical protein JHK82_052689 [Glycine max]